jgi:hypothetical protein
MQRRDFTRFKQQETRARIDSRQMSLAPLDRAQPAPQRRRQFRKGLASGRARRRGWVDLGRCFCKGSRPASHCQRRRCPPSLRAQRSNPAVVQGAETRSIGRSRLRTGATNSGRRVASGAAGLLRFARNDGLGTNEGTHLLPQISRAASVFAASRTRPRPARHGAGVEPFDAVRAGLARAG